MMLSALFLSLSLASIFFAMLRVRAPGWSFVVLGMLPPAALLLWSPGLRVLGYHGFVQAGIVYQVLQGNIPPTSPLLAGQPGSYPWVGTLLLAGISRLFGISPFWSASIVAMASLTLLLVAIYRIGLLATDDARASLFGTAVALYAFTFTQSVPNNALKAGLAALVPFPFAEPRGAPIVEKFNGCTSFPLGLALYAVALLLLLTMAHRSRGWRAAAGFTGSLAALAFVYPYFLPPIALLCGVAAILAWRDGGPERRFALFLAGVCGLVGVLVLPYYLQLAAARTNAALQVGAAAGLGRQAGVIVVTLLPMSVLLAVTRRSVRERLRIGGRPVTLLLASAGLNVLLFAVLSAPLWSQYKFLLLGVVALGIVGGIGFRELHERTWPVALAVLAVFLVPFALDCVHKANDWNGAAGVFRESGVALDHSDPARRELDTWMREKTHPRAVFIDADLGVPVYGQRALYVALPDQEPVKALTTQGGDGYALDPRIILKIVDGYAGDLVDRRQQTAARLLSGQPPTDADLRVIAAAGPRAYLVLRSSAPGTADRPRLPFPVAFSNAAATVLEVPRPAALANR
jgi:hypothetical protein